MTTIFTAYIHQKRASSICRKTLSTNVGIIVGPLVVFGPKQLYSPLIGWASPR